MFNILEPIDLLKNELKRLKKAIDKCTVSNYNSVSTNLNPWIEKYEKAINILNIAISNVEDENSPCYKCSKKCSEYCAHSCTLEDEYLKTISDEQNTKTNT